VVGHKKSFVTMQILFWRVQNTSVEGQALHSVACALEEPCLALADPSLIFSAAHNHAESIYNTLILMWNCKVNGTFVYPCKRMAHMLTILGRTIVTFCQQALNPPGKPTFWDMSPPHMRASLRSVLDLLHLWEGQLLRQLMQDWVSGVQSISKHAWEGPPFVDKPLLHFLQRIEDLKGLIDLQAELKSAVGVEQESAVDAAFQPLQCATSFQVRMSACTFRPSSMQMDALRIA
jgi:hypothetical protein